MSRKAVSAQELLSTKFNELEFEGDWLDHIGRPELGGVWFIWGNPSNGKTHYALQLAKYLTQFGKVGYNSVEEGISTSFKKAVLDVGLGTNNRFQLFHKETYEELDLRLSKRKSVEIVFIDSIQYFRYQNKKVTSLPFKDLTDKYHNKLFVVISHAQGKKPKGSTAGDIYYDASVKIWVEGFRATPQSRYGGKMPYVIWEEGALEVWGN